MTKAEADELLHAALQRLWNKHRRPVLGSQLKVAVIARAREIGAEFDEQALGFKSFSDYLRSNATVKLTTQSGSDLLVSPTDELNAQVASQALWIRPEFWRAFVTFAVAGEHRAYEPKADRIYRGSVSGSAGAAPPRAFHPGALGLPPHRWTS